MVASPLTIGIFGGSFNPVHRGHVAICEYVLAQHPATELLIVPCFQHAFAKDLAPFADRLAMCELAFGKQARVTISRIEEQLGCVSHTARMLRAVAPQYPGARLALVVGDDIEAELPRWQEPDWLRAHCDFWQVPRGAQSPIPDVSSTQVRDRLRRGHTIHDLVPPLIEAYVQARRLYVTR